MVLFCYYNLCVIFFFKKTGLYYVLQASQVAPHDDPSASVSQMVGFILPSSSSVHVGGREVMTGDSRFYSCYLLV